MERVWCEAFRFLRTDPPLVGHIPSNDKMVGTAAPHSWTDPSRRPRRTVDYGQRGKGWHPAAPKAGMHIPQSCQTSKSWRCGTAHPKAGLVAREADRLLRLLTRPPLLIHG